MMMGLNSTLKPDGSDCVFGLILLDVCRSFRVFETEKQEPTQFVSEKQKVELFSFILVPV